MPRQDPAPGRRHESAVDHFEAAETFIVEYSVECLELDEREYVVGDLGGVANVSLRGFDGYPSEPGQFVGREGTRL